MLKCWVVGWVGFMGVGMVWVIDGLVLGVKCHLVGVMGYYKLGLWVYWWVW